MRSLSDTMDLRPMLIGTLAINAGSSVGDTIDTLGFQDMLVIVQWAVTGGTAAAQGYLNIKLQEGDSAAGTGSDMTDISMGQIGGTFSHNLSYGTALTYPYLASTSFYERLGQKRDATFMGRYVRPIATLTGTNGCNHVYAISVLLGRPNDSTLIQRASIFASAGAEFQKAQWEGAG